MIVTIKPAVISGNIVAPASKSCMQRACALALLANGETTLLNPGKCNDDLAALDIIQKLGAEILQKEGYIKGVEQKEDKTGALVLELKYEGREPAINEIVRVSKPGHRIYKKANELPKVLNGFGIAIVSTPKGLMTNKDAVKLGLGGEVICSVY